MRKLPEPVQMMIALTLLALFITIPASVLMTAVGIEHWVWHALMGGAVGWWGAGITFDWIHKGEL